MKKLLIVIAVLFLLAVNSFSAVNIYTVEAPYLRADLATEKAAQQVGVREATGRNDGKQVEQYLASVGLPKGNPYCQAGIYWCWLQSWNNLFGGYNLDKLPVKRTGSTLAAFNHAKKIAIKKAPLSALQYSDLIYWMHANGKNGHVEVVEQFVSRKFVVTIGFNTTSGDKGNQREGQGVYRRVRSIDNKHMGNLRLHGAVRFTNG